MHKFLLLLLTLLLPLLLLGLKLRLLLQVVPVVVADANVAAAPPPLSPAPMPIHTATSVASFLGEIVGTRISNRSFLGMRHNTTMLLSCAWQEPNAADSISIVVETTVFRVGFRVWHFGA